MATPMMMVDNFGPVAWHSSESAHSATPGNLIGDNVVTSPDEINFDDWLDRNAYEQTPAPDDQTTHASTPELLPSLPLQFPSPSDSLDFVPTPTPRQGVTPHIAEATTATNGDYFSGAADAEEDPLERSFSKKRPSRTLTNISIALMEPLAKKRSQRRKKLEGGFPCRKECGQCFDRECDEKKHFERKHRDERYWPHECLHCPKRSQYPKDVWRHLEQTHQLKVPPKQPKSLRQQLGCPCCSKTASDWLERHNLAIVPVQTVSSPQTSPQTESPTSPATSPNILWTLTQSIMKLRRLSLKSRENKFIMATTDKSKFVEVDVGGINEAGALVSRIMTTLAQPQNAQMSSVQSYTRKSGPGPHLSHEALLSLVSKAADAEGTLKLLITTE